MKSIFISLIIFAGSLSFANSAYPTFSLLGQTMGNNKQLTYTYGTSFTAYGPSKLKALYTAPTRCKELINDQWGLKGFSLGRNFKIKVDRLQAERVGIHTVSVDVYCEVTTQKKLP